MRLSGLFGGLLLYLRDNLNFTTDVPLLKFQ